MGGDAKILHEVLQPEVGPGVFVPLKDCPRTQRDVVMIDLSQKRFGINWKGETSLTTVQVCEYFLQMVLKYQRVSVNAQDDEEKREEGDKGSVYAVLLLADKSTYVPAEKKRVQQIRAEGREKQNILPYPPGCVLVPGGLRLGAALDVELIDAARLAVTGYLFRQLLVALEAHLAAYHRDTGFKSFIVMDYYRQGEKDAVFCLDPAVRETTVFMGGYHNTVGEVDLLVNLYLSKEVCRDRPVRLYSSDLDHVPLLLLWWERERKAAPPGNEVQVYWIQHEKHMASSLKRKIAAGEAGGPLPGTKAPKPLYAVNIRALHSAIESGIPSMHEAKGEKVRAFVLFCILNETDFFQRKLLSHFFGPPAVLEAVCKAWPELNTLLHSIEKEEVGGRVDALRSFVYREFESKPTLFKDGGPPVVRVSASGTTESSQTWSWYAFALSQQKRFRFPTEENLNEALRELTFGWKYWSCPQ